MSQSELSLGGKEKLSAGYQKGEARPNLFLGLQSCHPSCLKFDIVKSKKRFTELKFLLLLQISPVFELLQVPILSNTFLL